MPSSGSSVPGGASRLRNKVALVTGAAGGIGRAVVERFAAEGAHVFEADRAESLKGEARAEMIALDVREPAGWQLAVEQVKDAGGRLDVLVNAAGVVAWTRFQDTTWPEYEGVIAVNQHGTFLGMQAVAEPMSESGGGSIINLSSIAGLSGAPAFAYSVSKRAVRGMTKSAALALAAEGIRVNSIHPGTIDTPMIADRRGASGAPLREDPSAIPVGRIGRPEDVAGLAVFLASDDAGFITGSEYVIDGGQTAAGGFPPLPKLPRDWAVAGRGPATARSARRRD